ncbi:hypothetical protein Ddc_10759 [Ditylenchus destructor]|nr:hypothetical protein Ddc_10759 [Ditylenchus destructor]
MLRSFSVIFLIAIPTIMCCYPTYIYHGPRGFGGGRYGPYHDDKSVTGSKKSHNHHSSHHHKGSDFNKLKDDFRF